MDDVDLNREEFFSGVDVAEEVCKFFEIEWVFVFIDQR